MRRWGVIAVSALALACSVSVAASASVLRSDRATASIGKASAAPPTDRKIPRYVICDGQVNPWIPVDYRGCDIEFSDRMLAKMWGTMIGQVKMLESRTVGLVLESADAPPFSEWEDVAPLCDSRTTTEGECNGFFVTLGHEDPDADPPHAWHEWECFVPVAVFYRPTNKLKTKKGRVWRMWKGPLIIAKPVLPSEVGSYPFCYRDPATDGWPGI